MKITVSRVLRMMVVLGPVFIHVDSYASDKVHLLFHMAQVVNGEFSVGATLENRTGTAVSESGIIIVPVDDQCHPLAPVFRSSGALAPGEKKTFYFPLTGKVSAYRLNTIIAVDDMGFSVPVSDDTAGVINERSSRSRAICQNRRKGGE